MGCVMSAPQTSNTRSQETASRPEAPPRPTAATPTFIDVPQLSLEEFKEATEDFSAASLLGEGSYGRVYYGVLRNGRPAAIKKLDVNVQPDSEFLEDVRDS